MDNRTSAKELQQLLESNVLAMGCWRANGRFTAANDALLQLIGYAQRGGLGKGALARSIAAGVRAENAEALKEAQVNGACTPFEKEILRKDGSRVPVFVGGETFGDGVTDAGVFFAVDLSKRKRGKRGQECEILPEILSLTDRQRVICLLLSYGEPEKRIARLLDLGLRTVELDKHRVAVQLGMPISRVVVWTVENRAGLLAAIRGEPFVPEAVVEVIGRFCWNGRVCLFFACCSFVGPAAYHAP